ncbi:MAG: transcriptional repressor [Methylococcaceae bacterium]|jgi:Fur family zinc uptake transcriptional regulator
MSVQHNHKHCIQHALASAEEICRDRNLRLTPVRKRILELIWSSHKTVGAYDLLDSFRHDMPSAKPVTIYRALEFLLAAGLIHKVESLNAFIGCKQPETVHRSAILICDHCHNAYEVEAYSVVQDIFALSQQISFTPRQLTLEVRGICADCQQIPSN